MKGDRIARGGLEFAARWHFQIRAMFVLPAICGASLLVGAAIGRPLARAGLKADFEVEAKPGLALGGIVLLGISACGLAAFDRFNRLSWLPYIFPSRLLLYVAAHFTDALFVGACFILGFIVALEAPGWRSPQRWRQMLVALLSIGCALGVLLHFTWPVAHLVKAPKFKQGVVMQTTPYTCAPASIVNLTRFLGTHPNLTERDVAELSHTSRFGTSTLNQLRTLEQLGIAANYEFGLTVSDLARRQQPAILIVRELYEGRRIGHAVALLAVDPRGDALILANPLVGLQRRSRQDMAEYWFGEAILLQVGESTASVPPA